MSSKSNRVNLSCTVTKEVKDKLTAIADWEDQTVSRLAAKAIKFYIQEQQKKDHPALKNTKILESSDDDDSKNS
jgi:hypothetical protein